VVRLEEKVFYLKQFRVVMTRRLLRRRKKHLRVGALAIEILEKGLVPGVQSLGKLFRDGQVYLPEILISASLILTWKFIVADARMRC